MLDFKFLVFHFIYAYATVYGFAILFNSPRKLNRYSAFAGAVAWVFYQIVANADTAIFVPYFVASLLLSFISEFYARKLKHPSIIFTIPAIIPFVPGYGIYYMIIELLNKDYDKAVQIGTESIFIAIAIASGLIIATSITRMLFKENSLTLIRKVKNSN